MKPTRCAVCLLGKKKLVAVFDEIVTKSLSDFAQSMEKWYGGSETGSDPLSSPPTH